jgi:HAD superfamily hydrolase (TIGR01490 family)
VAQKLRSNASAVLPTIEGVVANIAESSPGPRVGAFFDLDGTLVAGITATAHATDRIRRGQAGLGEVVGVLEAAMRYRFGRVQFEELVVRAAGYLRGESLADLDELGERLFTDQVASRVYPRMREIVQAHQQRSHTVVLCSSALTIHAEPVARSCGIKHVLCNHFETDGQGVLTGEVTKPVIWGSQKAAAVQGFCSDAGVDLQSSYFYADGDEDAALMSLVGHPRPVNARAGLAAMAAEHGWPVLRLTGRANGLGSRVRSRGAGLGSPAVLRAVIAQLATRTRG